MYGSPYGYPYGHGYGHGNVYGWPQIGVGWRLDGYGRWWHPQQGYEVPWPNYFQQPDPRTILSTAASSGCGGHGHAVGDGYGDASYWERMGKQAYQAYTNPTGTAVSLAANVFSAFTGPKKLAIDALKPGFRKGAKVDLNSVHFHPLGGGRFLNDISHRVYNAGTQTWE